MRLIILVAMLVIPWSAMAGIPITIATGTIDGEASGLTSGPLPLTGPFSSISGLCSGSGSMTVSVVGGALQVDSSGASTTTRSGHTARWVIDHLRQKSSYLEKNYP